MLVATCLAIAAASIIIGLIAAMWFRSKTLESSIKPNLMGVWVDGDNLMFIDQDMTGWAKLDKLNLDGKLKFNVSVNPISDQLSLTITRADNDGSPAFIMPKLKVNIPNGIMYDVSDPHKPVPILYKNLASTRAAFDDLDTPASN